MNILSAPVETQSQSPSAEPESTSENSPALLALAVIALLVGVVALRRRKKN